VSKKTQILVLS